MFRFFSRLALCLFACTGCGPYRAPELKKPNITHFDQLAQLYWELGLKRNPTRASYLGYRAYDARLADLSANARAEHTAQLKRLSVSLNQLLMTPLPDSTRTHAAVLRTQLHQYFATQVCQDWSWVVDQLQGPQVQVAGLPDYHIVDGPERAGTLLKRYAAFGHFFNQHIANLAQGRAEGRVASRVNISRVIEQLTRMVDDPIAESPFVRTVLDKATSKAPANLKSELIRSVEKHVYPALNRYLTFLREQLEPGSRSGVSVTDLPQGHACYQARITQHTGLKLAADQIHAIGLNEVTRIHREMKAIVQEMGGDDVETFLGALAERADQHLKTPEALLAYNRSLVERARSVLGQLVGRRPTTAIIVKAIEPFREQDAPAAYYYSAPSDGSRPAAYYLNTYAPTTRLLYKMPALAFHEALPGHHLQLALAAENRELPRFMRHGGHTAFVEGWALYSEKLAGEFGLYETPEEKLGALTYEIWRAARLVVDTGLHAKGWSRARAIDYLSLTTGHDPGEVINEIDRYIIWPGQALAYKMGQLELSRLRAEVQDTLGDGFDLRAFHDAVLQNGALPLDVLRDVIKRWLGRSPQD